MSSKTFAQRISGPPPMTSRQQFLNRHHASKFCGVLAGGGNSIRWPTIVLGSGWMSTDGRKASMTAMLTRVAHAVNTATSSASKTLWNDLPDGTSMSDAVCRFAADLIADRLGVDAAPPGMSAAMRQQAPTKSEGADNWSEGADNWIVSVLATAMLTTHTYFVLRAMDPAVSMHRSDHHELVTISKPLTSIWLSHNWVTRTKNAVNEIVMELNKSDEPESDFAVFASRALAESAEKDNGSATAGLQTSFNAVAKRISDSLSSEGLEVSDVKTFTELAWFSLASMSEGTYPGWRDLLLDLSQYECTENSSVGRPSFDRMTSAANWISSRYAQVTTTSQSGSNSMDDESRSVHESVAELLVAQNEYREAFLNESKYFTPPAMAQRRPPVAVVHVTSFDLELELALLKLKQSFDVLFPVFVYDSLSRLLHLRWCRLEVDGEAEGLECILDPAPEKVSLLSGESREIDETNRPLVVRLSGCPLIGLPKLKDHDGLTTIGQQILGKGDASAREASCDYPVFLEFQNAYKRGSEGATLESCFQQAEEMMSLQHAVIVGEHDAMLHNAVDSQQALERALCSRLPVETVSNDRKWDRYWMLLGVQVADHAIRQRVAFVVNWYPTFEPRKSQGSSSARAGNSTNGGQSGSQTNGGQSESQSVVGVLVSQSVGEEEQDLMFWNRLDIVSGTEAHEFANDLEDLAGHYKMQFGVTQGSSQVTTIAMSPC